MVGEVVKGVVLAAVSDLHGGSTIGLCPPAVALDDGGLYTYSPAQAWLWDRWKQYWLQVETTVRATGFDLHLLLNGDLVDGDHHGTSQIVSRNPNTQMDIIKAALAIPMALKPKTVVVVRGTEVHVGPNGSTENSLAGWISQHEGTKVIPDPETGKLSHWHFRGEYGGVLVDAAHHGKMGTRAWTRANAALMQAAEITMSYAISGDRIPALAFRSHYHQWADSGNNYPVRLVQLPAYQLATAFVHRIAPGALADIGGAVAVIKDGEVLSLDRVLYRPARPAVQLVA